MRPAGIAGRDGNGLAAQRVGLTAGRTLRTGGHLDDEPFVRDFKHGAATGRNRDGPCPVPLGALGGRIRRTQPESVHGGASNRRGLPGICPGSPIHCCDEEFTTPQRRGADLAVPKPREVSISSVKFERYKAFRSFSISLQRVNILVGPNNCGKSTIIRAFRVLDIALRQARTRRAQRISYNDHTLWGHRLSEDRLPISLENIHTDYEDTDAKVTFRCSNGNFVILVFPPDGGCFLIPDAQGRDCRTPGNFKNRFPIDIQVVPELGPLEDEEVLLAEETVRRGLSTHRASRHFRNYWHLYPQGFDEFAELVG